MTPEYQRALDFIEAAEASSSLAQLRQVFARALASFGVPHFSVGIMVSPDGVAPRQFEMVLRGVSDAWSLHYWEQNYFNVDAAVHLALQQPQAFTWTDVEGMRISDTSRRLFGEIRDAMPVRGGYVIPAHDAQGFAGIVSMTLEDALLHPDHAQPLKLMGLCALYRARLLYESERGAQAKAITCPLSARQREILAYAAMGKSETDTGDILSVSSTTVRDHLVKIREALGVRTKMQAVALAVRNGWIMI